MHALRSQLPASGQLVRIATLWGIRSTKYPDDATLCQVLIKRMADPIAARFVWEQLDEAGRLVLWQCIGKQARHGCHHETAFVRTGLSEKAFDATIAELSQALLLTSTTSQNAVMLGAYEESAAALYVTGRELFFPGAVRTDQALDKLLSDLSKPDLWHLVHSYQLDPTGLSSLGDLRKALVHALAGLDIVKASMVRQDPFVQRVLFWLYGQGGVSPLQSIGEVFNLDAEALYLLLRQLADAGLAFDTLCPGQIKRQLFVPLALRQCLANKTISSGSRETAELLPLSGPPPFIEEGLPRIALDLAIAAHAAYQQRIDITRSSQVMIQCAQRIEPYLKGGRTRQTDATGAYVSYLELVFRAAKHLQLIERKEPPWAMGIKDCYVPGHGLATWASLTLEAQTRRLLSEWVAGKIWQDVFGESYHQWSWSSWKPETGRTLLLSFLRQRDAGKWYSIEVLLKNIWERDPYALRPELKEATNGRHATIVLQEKWWNAEGAFFKGLLLSTLWELGIVSLGYEQAPSESETACAIAFQITELGATVLQENLSQDILSQKFPPSPLIIQSNFEAILLHYDPQILFQLLPWAESVQIQQACQLQFTQHSIQQAIFHGQRIEHLLQVLEERSGKALPQGVEYRLKEWAGCYQEVQIAQGLILSVSDEATASHLRLAPAFRGFGLIQIAPLVFLAPAHANVAELRRLLEKERIAVHLARSVSPPKVSRKSSQKDE